MKNLNGEHPEFIKGYKTVEEELKNSSLKEVLESLSYMRTTDPRKYIYHYIAGYIDGICDYADMLFEY